MTMTDNTARLGVDVGGTFTDVILQRADGTAAIRKVLSTPPRYDVAVVSAGAGLASGSTLAGVVHGTTVATNAVLEQRGASHGARHDGRLPRRSRAAAPAHPADVRAVLAKARPARPSAPALRGPRADGRRRRGPGAARRRRCARRRGRAARGGGRVRRRVPAARVPLSRARGAARRDPARRAARRHGLDLLGDPPRAARVRADGHDRRERLCPSADGALRRRDPDRARRRRDRGAADADAVLGWRHDGGGRDCAAGARARVGAGGRCRGRAGDRAPSRLPERHRLRHGRDDGQGVAHRARHRVTGTGVRGRRLAFGRLAPHARLRRAAPHPDDRHRGGRRRRRLDRLAGHGGGPPGRTSLGGRRPRACVLRQGWDAANGYRRKRLSRLRPRRLPSGRRDRRRPVARGGRAGAARRRARHDRARACHRNPRDRERADDACAAVGVVREGPRPARLRPDRLRRRRPGARDRARRRPRLPDRARSRARRPLQRGGPALRTARVPRGARRPTRRARRRSSRARPASSTSSVASSP